MSVVGFVRRTQHELISEEKVRKSFRRYPLYSRLPACIGNVYFVRAMREHVCFQFWTKEFIEALATYLWGRVSSPKSVILDAGAGNGLLTRWLQRSGLNVTGVDNRHWFQGGNSFTGPVKPRTHLCPEWIVDMNYKDALKSLEPEIVVCAWMPRDHPLANPDGAFWDVEFRGTPSVREYILIGCEAACGWSTGKDCPVHDMKAKRGTFLKGWEEVALEELSRRSISAYELGLGSWLEAQGSNLADKTVVLSFRRVGL